jgi:hypothetical protein
MTEPLTITVYRNEVAGWWSWEVRQPSKPPVSFLRAAGHEFTEAEGERAAEAARQRLWREAAAEDAAKFYAAQRAATAVIGVGPDPRDYWGEYLTVDAQALAALFDALQVPCSTVHGAVLNVADVPAQEEES